MTLRFLPSIRSARGKILNVASIAAYFPGGPGMAAYYASKSFVLSFSLALSQELHSQRRHGLGAVSRLHQDGFSGPRWYRCKHGPGPSSGFHRQGGRRGGLCRADRRTPRDCAWLVEQTRHWALAIFAKVHNFSGYFAVAAKSGSRPLKPRSGSAISNRKRCLKGSNPAAGSSSSCIKHIQLRGGSGGSCARKDLSSIAGVPVSTIRCRKRYGVTPARSFSAVR